MGRLHSALKLFLLLAGLFSVQANALLDYGQLLEEKQVDLLPFLVIPISCSEFIPAQNVALPQTPQVQAQTSAYQLALASQSALIDASKTASLQQFYWLATPHSYTYYLGASYFCHRQAITALEKSLQASKLALTAASSELDALQFEAGSSLNQLKASQLVTKAQREDNALATGKPGSSTPIASLLLSASSKSSQSFQNVLTSSSGIVESVGANFKLLEALAELKFEASSARSELQSSLLEKQSSFEVSKAVARTRLQFIDQEQLDAVADEWFAYLPSGSIAVTGAQPSFRETVRSSKLGFDQGDALATEGTKTIQAKKEGWAGKTFELYSNAAGNMKSSLQYAADVEERSRALEESLSQSATEETNLLWQKAAKASPTNPVGSSYAYSVARQTFLSYEELAGAPRGKKIREFVGLLKNLREASEVAQQSPSFKWALDFLEEQVADAQRLVQAAQKDGLEVSFYQKHLKQAQDAVAQLKESRGEDFTLASTLSSSVLELKSSLEKEIGERFASLHDKLALIGRLRQYLSQEDAKQLELYARSSNLQNNAGSLGEALQWANQRLAELSSKSQQIIGQHLGENAFATQSMQATFLDSPAQGELFWRVEHALPLDSKEKITISLPQLEGAAEIALHDGSGKVEGINGTSIVLSNSSQGDRHYARISFRKIIARKTAQSISSTATGKLLERRAQVTFSSSAATRVLFERKVSSSTTVYAQAIGSVESSENQTQQGKITLFSIEAREGGNSAEFVEQTPNPVSVSKSVFYDSASGKLSFLYDISNQLDQEISGLELDLQENVACLEGKATVSSNAAQSVEQKRSGHLIATRLNGMHFTPMEKQSALLEVECNNVSLYAQAKLQDLSANPEVPIAAAQEFSDAQKAFQSGDFARAAQLAAGIENKLLQAQQNRQEIQQVQASLSLRAQKLQAEGEELLNASLQAGNQEFSTAGEQISSQAKAANSVIEGLAGAGNLSDSTNYAQKIAQVEGILSQGEAILSNATNLVTGQISGTLKECASTGGDSLKASACASANNFAWRAKEKLLLEKPGAAVQLLQKARQAIDGWRSEREAKLSQNKELAAQLKLTYSNASALIEKAGKELESGSQNAGVVKAPEIQIALAALKSLQAEAGKAGKINNIFDSGVEAQILALEPTGIEVQTNRLQNATQKLEASLGAVELLASSEVDSAQRRSRELGDQNTEAAVSKAKDSLQAGSLITAFALASGVNGQLEKRIPAGNGFGAREAVLAGSGIAILILLAFVFTRKGDSGPEKKQAEMDEIEQAAASASAPSEEDKKEKAEDEVKYKPSYY